MEKQKILNDIENYYSQRIQEYGVTPRGVDWKDRAGQRLRFEILTKFLPKDGLFDLLDYGSGSGDLFIFLSERYKDFSYTGFDISPLMNDAAKGRFEYDSRFNIATEIKDRNFDYLVASGVFNVLFGLYSYETWTSYVIDTLDEMNRLAVKCFSFNMLTRYSDKTRWSENLYYGSPEFYFKYCAENYSRKIDLIQSYDLYEFTIIVYKK